MNSPVDTIPLTQASGRSILYRPFNEAGEFASLARQDELRRLAVRGVSATTLAQGLGLFIQIVSTLILARILTPTDFGLITMVTTFSLLFVNAGGNGFTEAVLQRPQLNRTMASNLFWINVGTGCVLTLIFAAAGSLMARFYGNPRVAVIAAGMSLTIFFTSFNVLHIALLMRAMRFPTVYANQMLARFISVVVSVFLALAGWGVWALVGGAVMQPLAESVGIWVLCRWKPSLPRSDPATGSMVNFALHVYGRFSFNYFSRNCDNLLVGWRFNAQSLGFYKKAYDLFALSSVLQSFTSVAVSALSRMNQDAEQYKTRVLKALSVAALLGMGVGGAVTLVGKDLIRVMLGPGWGPAGHIFVYFGPGFGIMFIYAIHSWIHLSLGKPDRWFKWGIIEFAVTVFLFVVALPWGPAGVAASWSLSLLLLALPSLVYAGKPVNLALSSVVGVVWRYFVAAVGTVLVMAVMIGGFLRAEPSNAKAAIVRMLVICLLFAVLYLVAVILMYRSRAPLDQIIGLLQEMTARRRQNEDQTADPVGVPAKPH